jgi:hypothetical protein
MRVNTGSFRGTTSESDPYSKEEFSLNSFGTKLTRKSNQVTRKKLSNKSPRSVRSGTHKMNYSVTKKNLNAEFKKNSNKENNPRLANLEIKEIPEIHEKPPKVPSPVNATKRFV